MQRSIADAGWRFDNSYARLPEPLFTPAVPASVRAPAIVVLNAPLAADLGLDPEVLEAEGAAVFAGNALPPGATPIAQAYAGHQFGQFTNLGDGRAILLGEQLTPDGRRYDIQLKGSGRTRYSRGGDGRAALGPMLREHIVSEGMHALGIPTTRSLAVATTGEQVLRATPLPGAVLTRVAASHIRVGTFQYAAALADEGLLAPLFEHALARHDPELARADDPAAAFLEAVVERQAALVARWILVGFVHGVMNTDNMVVSGETIDYGPCAFLDAYDPATVFSSIDRQGRYAYSNQPAIAHWNLARLAESLLPLMKGGDEAALERAQGVLGTFPERFERHRLAGARAKLGLISKEEGDGELFAALLERMHETRADFTATFAGLARWAEAGPSAADGCGESVFSGWCDLWRARLTRQSGTPAEAAARMQRVNPVVIPRNHRVEEALTAAEAGDFSVLHRLLAVLHSPFDETPENEAYRVGPPAGCGPYRTFCGT
ncbi:MAG: YdiU family protein [Planctomycetia bacterium]|nr:YdiU family protein [Planctomycetia bacterium]